jgi:hypothetical protein
VTFSSSRVLRVYVVEVGEAVRAVRPAETTQGWKAGGAPDLRSGSVTRVTDLSEDARCAEFRTVDREKRTLRMPPGGAGPARPTGTPVGDQPSIRRTSPARGPLLDSSGVNSTR